MKKVVLVTSYPLNDKRERMWVSSRARRRTVLFGTLLLAALVIFAGCPADGGGGGGDATPPARAVSVSSLSVANEVLSFVLENPNTEAVRVGISIDPAAPDGAMIEFDEETVAFTTAVRVPLTATGDADATKLISITEVVNNTQYTVTATTFDESGNAHSDTTSDTTSDIVAPTDTPPDPVAPENLTAMVIGETVVLSWERVTNATSYRVYRNDSVMHLATDLTEPTYTDSTIVRGTAYSYRVRAVSIGLRESENSIVASVNPPTLPPGNLMFTPGDAGITLNWNMVAGATTYSVYRSDAATPIAAIKTGIADLTHIDSTALKDTAYTYIVRSMGNNGIESDNSNTVTAILITPPANLIAELADAVVTLTWDATVAGVAGYRVYRDGELLTTDEIITALTYIDNTAVRGTTHSYRVRSVGHTGVESINSNEATASPATRPPVNVMSTARYDRVTLTWNEVPGAIRYNVYRNDDVIATGVTDRTYIDNDSFALSLLYQYSYIVRSVGSNGIESGDSDAIIVKIPVAPPRNVNGFGILGQVSITWNPSSDADNYLVYRDGELLATLESSVLLYRDKTVVNGTKYRYTMRLLTSDGVESVDSDVVVVTPPLTVNFDTLPNSGNNDPAGIWSNGTTMWVADNRDNKIYAYNLTTEARDAAKDFDTLVNVGNTSPQGLWSNGTTMWVLDETDAKIYAYNLMTKAPDPDKDINSLSGVTAPGPIWSNKTAAIEFADATMWVINVSNGNTKILAYNMATGARVPGQDFTLATENRFANGMSSNGTTMWVSDYTDGKIYAYNLTTKAPVPAKDFDTLSAAGNEQPTYMWSNASTMRVVDLTDARIYTYNLLTKAHIE